jgi:hypothetical protein
MRGDLQNMVSRATGILQPSSENDALTINGRPPEIELRDGEDGVTLRKKIGRALRRRGSRFGWIDEPECGPPTVIPPPAFPPSGSP